jgi:MraZ protein
MGRSTSTLDAKSRVAVPAKVRRATADGVTDRFVITLGLDGCLFLFPPDYWDRVVQRLEDISFTGRRAKFFTRVLMSNADYVELDKQSRIRIPQHLIDAIGLEKDVLFIGALRRIELWRPDTYEKYVQDFDSSYEDVAEEILL